MGMLFSLAAFPNAGKAFAAVNPSPDMARASIASDLGDQSSLRALFQVLPPSAQGVRVNIAETDLNVLGGNAPQLQTVNRFSPLMW